MQDRFKFRFWNKKDCKMQEWNGCHFWQALNNENLVPMQCTGLKDENGKLIYEGDIVNIFHVSSTLQGRNYIDVVGWNNARSRFDTKNYGILNEDDIYEVIGNVYENPELLAGRE